jgi:hypothetical protein
MVLAALAARAGAARAEELAPAEGRGDRGRWTLLGDLGATLVSRSSTASTSLDLARAQALGVGLDRRFGSVHLFARGEANAWRDRRDDGTDDFVLVFDLGLGAALDWGGGRLRSSLALGAAILAVPTDVDSAGSIGTFVDVRPLGYAWRLGPGVRLGVVPLSFTLSIPVLTGIPLVSIQYRTMIFAERDL